MCMYIVLASHDDGMGTRPIGLVPRRPKQTKEMEGGEGGRESSRSEKKVETEADGDSESSECPVCYGTEPVEKFLQTKCDHKFCRSCAVKILKGSVAGNCPMCRQKISVYDFMLMSTGQTLVKRPTTIFGGVYIQGGTEGLASYHFSEAESYISYSAAPPNWLLDDGSPPPVKKPFLNSHYDPSTRTFIAVVDWTDVNFHGDAKWFYRIIFSEDFSQIEGGEVLSYDSDGGKRRWHAYGQNLFYVRLENMNFDL